jgi:fucose permease
MKTPERASGAVSMLKNKGIWLCIIGIFLGGASECTMAQWSSGYLEAALGIPKVWGDIFGVAMFAVMLGLGRSLYAKYGKGIERVLFLGAVGATVCYLTAAVSSVAILGLVACALTGFCTSMMWPGSLIVASDRFPTGGVFIFAIMAAGGDLGASVGPQLIGIITDTVSANATAQGLAQSLSLSPEQLGMKLGMLVGMLFPLCAIGVYARLRKIKSVQP